MGQYIPAELDAITIEHFTMDDGKAWDINYNTSARIQRKLKQRKGLQIEASGDKIKVPLAYNEAIGGTFVRGGTLNSNDRQLITTVEYTPASIYGNGTIYGQDEVMNSSPEGKVKLVRQKSDSAAKKPFLVLARTAYGSGTDSSEDILGVTTICSETVTQQVGGKAENDIVDANGVKPWEGKTYSTAMVISSSTVRDRIAEATFKDGPDGSPTHIYMPNALLNAFKDSIQGMQQVGEDKEMTKIGFHNIVFDGVTFFRDDFIPAGYMFIENENYIGFAVYPEANMLVMPWGSMLDGGGNVWGKTMKVLWMGNQVVSDRRGHELVTSVS